MLKLGVHAENIIQNFTFKRFKMKKSIKNILLVAAVSFAACLISCNPSPSGVSLPADFVEIKDAKVVGSNACNSEVFINGRTVDLGTYAICNHEVTLAEWKSVMGGAPSMFKDDIQPAKGENREKRAVAYVSWYDAIAYCNKLSIQKSLNPCYKIKDSKGGYTVAVSAWVDQNGKNPGEVPTSQDANWDDVLFDVEANGFRLPTEAEWEYAARGASFSPLYKYSGSNDVAEVSWYSVNAGNKIHEVGRKKANQLGLYDMSGNVEEWCWDWFGSIDNEISATGPESGVERVLRGGGHGDKEIKCQVGERDRWEPDNNYLGYVGFRVCISNY